MELLLTNIPILYTVQGIIFDTAQASLMLIPSTPLLADPYACIACLS